MEVAKSRYRRFPSRLVIQSDNTEAQANNATVMLCVGLFGCPWLFVSVDIMVLMVGHTYVDVDELFAVVCEYLGRRQDSKGPCMLLNI